MSLRPAGATKARADPAALLGADGDVLEVGLRRRQAPGRGRRERVGGVDPPRRGIDEAGQGVGIGRLELRHLAPFENPRGQCVSLGGEIFEHARRGRPGAGRRFFAARQAHLAEQDVAELLGRAEIERRADDFRRLRPPAASCPARIRRKYATGCCGRSPLRAAPCAREARRAGAPAARKPSSSAPRRGAASRRARGAARRPPSPPHIRRPCRSRRARSRRVAARAGDRAEGDRLMAEIALGERVDAVARRVAPASSV